MKLVVMQKWRHCLRSLNKNSVVSKPYFFIPRSLFFIYSALVHQFIPICQFSFGRKRVLSVCVFTYSTKKFILSHHLHGACQFLPPVFTPSTPTFFFAGENVTQAELHFHHFFDHHAHRRSSHHWLSNIIHNIKSRGEAFCVHGEKSLQSA